MSRSATARLFAALDPSLEVREALAAWARGATAGWGSRAETAHGPSVRVLEARSLHLTLCFLDSRPVAEIEALASALGACAAPVGELSVGAPLLLPPRRPRALAVEIHDRNGELDRLQRALSDALAQASRWEPERRRFKAHITLARMREGFTRTRASAVEQSSLALTPTPQLRFTPEAIVLYRSLLEPTGAIYEAIAACDLAPAGRPAI
jgi:RNA 2',3'-cyclic 3'-phosphodiesterase